MSRRSERLEFLYRHYFRAEVYVADEDITAPSAPPTPTQQTFPTSAYGQTIPVLYGKGRVPGGYVWAAPIDVSINEDTVSVKLTARVRFARPLVANSNWRLRRLWADGRLAIDATTGYRSPLIEEFRQYDGQSTQDRDPLMVEEEGEDNVSAHRGYLDMVIRMELGSQASQPPTFDAEWVQDADTSADIQAFTAFSNDPVSTYPSVNWAAGVLYGWTGPLIRVFQISTLREVYAVTLQPVSDLGRVYINVEETGFRYVSQADTIIAIAAEFGANPWYLIAIDPHSGTITAESISGLNTAVNQCCHIRFANSSVLIGSTATNEHVFSFHCSGSPINSITRVFFSGTHWNGYNDIDCMAPGALHSDKSDVWITADNKLVKAVVNSSGMISSVVEHASFADDLRYCVYHDGDVIVWTDAAEVIRVDGVTGATIWTKTVPYQISSPAALRGLAAPDMQRLEASFLFLEDTRYNITDLDKGTTIEIAKSVGLGDYAYDSRRQWLIRTDNINAPTRTTFDDVGEGLTRDLTDFLGALTEVDDGFSSSEHDEIGIDDQIEGAVIDVTGGVRDVARSVAGPYSIAIFERAGKIIYKRAATDGAFAVDATLTASDFVDRGGQAIRAKRLNPEEFIARYGINYRDPAEIYQARPQYGEIQFVPFPVSPTDISVKADIPIIASGTIIKTLATKKVNRLAVELHEFTFSLKAKYCDLEPEDILLFSYAGRTVSARVIETTMNPDFTIEVKSTEFLSKVDITVAGAAGRPIEPTAVGLPESLYYHLDIPLQFDTDDLGGDGLVQYHVLTSQGQDNWDGATLYRRETAGTYLPISSQVQDGLVGVALTALPDADNPYVTEFTRTINVAVISGDTDLLTSQTYLEVMNGANRFAIGAPGRWEVCHVIGITDNGDGSFAFTGLVRGRGVSEEHTASHEIGDYVVWLSDDNVQNVAYTIDALDDAFSYKPVGFGGNITTTPAVSRTVTGEAEKIPKPCQLDAVINASDIDLSWVRRGRIGVIWDDDGDFTTPLGETLEQYVVRIKDAPGGTVLRTFTVDDATTKKYLAADITTDFGSLSTGDDLTYDIRQVSGSGVVCPTREATVTL